MLDESQLAKLGDALAASKTTLRLVLHRGDEDPALGDMLEELARSVEAVGGGAVEIVEGGEAAARLPSGPGLTVATGAPRNIHYLALPEGLEAEPFVDLVVDLAGETALPDEGWVRDLTDLERPAEVLVFVSAACPHCARTVRAAQQLARASENVTVIVIDAQRFEAMAAEHQVRSVPLTLVDRELGLTGPTTPAELTAHVSGRGTPDYRRNVLISLIERNRLDDAVARISEGDGASAFTAAWRQSAMSLRMGLMLIAEQVLEADPRVFDGVVEDLLPALGAEDAGLRGDTADLLGMIGHPAALPALADRVTDPNEDVAEAVAEAIETIREKDRA